MFIRLNSDNFPKRYLLTENEYTVCNDKSGVQIKADLDEQGNLVVGPVGIKNHACIISRNPELGIRMPQIVTPDSDLVLLDNKLTKKQAETAAELPWHYRIYFMRIDTPYFGEE